MAKAEAKTEAQQAAQKNYDDFMAQALSDIAEHGVEATLAELGFHLYSMVLHVNFLAERVNKMAAVAHTHEHMMKKGEPHVS